MKKLFVSVILSVYDAPKSLTLVLEGYRRQSTNNFELIIADDGSPPEMKAIVQEFAKTAPFEVKYLWHEDKGFRKTKINNECVKVSKSDWLIFSDGDCIPSKNFVKAHIDSAESNTYCEGFTVNLPLDYCQVLTPQIAYRGDYERFLPFYKRLRLKASHFRDFISGYRRFTRPHPDGKAIINTFYDIIVGRSRVKGLTARNFSCDKDLFYAVNGFDENFVNLNDECGDLMWRFDEYGAKYRDLWHAAYVFHLDRATDKSRLSHPSRDAARTFEYQQRPDIPIHCENGLVKKGAYANMTNYDLSKIGF